MSLSTVTRPCCSTEFVAASPERAETLHLRYHNEQASRGRRESYLPEYNLLCTRLGSVPALVLAGVSWSQADGFASDLVEAGVPAQHLRLVRVSQ